MDLEFVECALCLNKCSPSARKVRNVNKEDSIPLLSRDIASRDDEEDALLKDQLQIMFLLRKILEIPQKQCCTFLQVYGDPSLWIDCCDPCSVLVKRAKFIFEQILMLQNKFEMLQNEIKNTIIQTGKYKEYVVGESELGVKETIRSFIKGGISNVKITIPKEEITSDFSPDLNATELSDFSAVNLDSCFVKNERIEEAESLLCQPNELSNEDDKYDSWEHESLEQNETGISYLTNVALKEGNTGEICSTEVNGRIEVMCYPILSLNSDSSERDPLSVNETAEANTYFHTKESTQSRRFRKILPKGECNSLSDENFKGCFSKSSNQSAECKDTMDVNGASNSNTFTNDLEIHTKETPKTLSFGGNEFSTNSTSLDLNSYENGHTGKKSNECRFCGKCFSNSRDVNRHEKTHTGEKDFECEICGRGFIQASSLKRHGLIHTGERPHKCNYCGKGFTTPTELNLHEKIHTGQEPYKCDICGKGFLNSGTFQTHMNVHNGVKPYKCDICGKRFTQIRSLKDHINMHNGLKPHKCEFCGKTFLYVGTLRRHKKAHTGEESQNATTNVII